MLVEKIKTLKRSDGKINSAIIRRDEFVHSDLNVEILKRTEFLSNDATYSERFYVIEHDIYNAPICPVCTTNTCNFSKITGRYNNTCSTKQCITSNTTPNPTLASTTKSANKSHIINALILDDASLLSAVNVIHQVEEIGISRIRTTKHYDIVRSLYHITKLVLPEFDVNTIAQRYYHIVNDLHTIPICEICKTTPTSFINSYAGYRKSCHDRSCFGTLSARNKAMVSTNNVIDKLTESGYAIIKFDYLNSGNSVELKCPKGHLFTRFIHNGRWVGDNLCTICNRALPFSTEEKKVLSDIKEYYDGVILENYKFSGTKEIDIFIPEFNLGIEYNGIYWHSYDRKETPAEKLKHSTKTDLALEQGIKLIQINSIDYARKSDIIHSRIKNLMNLSNKIYARNCVISNISVTDEREFLNVHHLQGYAASTVAYKLTYESEIVAIMSFVTNRFGGTAEYELLRYVSKSGTTIVGGASKLFNHFIKEVNPTDVISYSLRDWGIGNLYKMLGFTFIAKTPPNFIYFKGYNVLRRHSCQKHKLKKLLGDGFNEKLPAADNMFLNGWRRYWDTGSTKWIYTNPI